MKPENTNQPSRDKSVNPNASDKSDEKVIRHETIPGEKSPNQNKRDASVSTTDEDLN